MLNTNVFIKTLIRENYSHLCVVPCSFAKNLINASINYNKHLEYVPCASEAVACSIAAGLTMAGKKPLVIVQSSGLTNMGSCITSLLKPYGINFPMLVSWRSYTEGDSEIQHAHLATELPELIKAYGYKHELMTHSDEELAVKQLTSCQSAQKILILQKDTFSKVVLEEENQLDLSKYSPRSDYLKHLNTLYANSDTVFIGTTGNTAREMYTFMPNTKNFYMAGNMGGALSIGLGLSLSGKNVVICGGDAEFVMHLGGLTTAGRYNTNITYLLFDNESNKSTGGQNSYQSHLDYKKLSKASGWNTCESTVENIVQFKDLYKEPKMMLKTLFHIKSSYDEETVRPPKEVVINSKQV